MSRGVTYIELPTAVKRGFEEYASGLDALGKNPYKDFNEMTIPVGSKLLELLISENSDPKQMNGLLKIIKDKHEGKKFSAIMVTNGPRDKEDSIIGAPYFDDTYDYANDAKARGKTGFTSEWFELALGAVLGNNIFLDPHDHGGDKPFQMVSPRKGEEANTSSLSIDFFPWHMEAVHANPHPTREELLAHLNSSTNLTEVGKRLNFGTPEAMIESMLNARNKSVDGLVLGAIVNKATPTSLVTSELLKELLIEKFGEDKFQTLSKINIAVISGHSELGNKGKLGYIGNILKLDKNGDITEIRLNMGKNRMQYTGNRPDEQKLFDDFCNFMRSMDKGTKVILQPGQYLYMDNKLTIHSRDSISQVDFGYPLSKENFKDIRMLVREYLKKAPETDLVKMIETTSVETNKSAREFFNI